MITVYTSVLPVSVEAGVEGVADGGGVIVFETADVAMAVLPPGTLSYLDRKLKLDSNDDAEDVAKEVEAFANLLVLELKGNTIGVGAGERIAEALKKHPELQRCLWSDMFTGRLKAEIPPILKSLGAAMMFAGAQLTEIDLSDNAFGPIGAEGIQDLLVSKSCYTLQTLKLNNNGLGAGGKVIARCLSDCWSNAKRDGHQFRLKVFVAGRNRLENPGAIALAESFKKIGSLEEITVLQNGIRAEGITALAGCLEHNPNLRVVNFNDNTATASGGVAVARGLAGLRKLEVLNMGDLLVRDGGALAIVGMLCDAENGGYPQLREVCLDGNELSSMAVREIVGKWRGKPAVALSLGCNSVGGEWTDIKDWVDEHGLGKVDMGNESDDEGTLEPHSEDEGDEDEDEEYDEDEMEEGEEKEEEGEQAKPDVATLLSGVGCMKMNPPAPPPTAAVASPVSNPFAAKFAEFTKNGASGPIGSALPFGTYSPSAAAAVPSATSSPMFGGKPLFGASSPAVNSPMFGGKPLFGASSGGSVLGSASPTASPLARKEKGPETAADQLSFLDKQMKMNTAQDAAAVVAAVSSHKSLRMLELRGNTLGIEAGAAIGEALKKHPEMERCLWSDLFTGRLKTEIPPILKSLGAAMMFAGAQLTEIDLSDNAFGPIGAEGIQDLLVSKSCYTLQTLKLNNNGLGAGGKVIAGCLSDCFDNAARDGSRFALKTFIAGRNRLEIPGATALSAAFKKIGSLEEITIHQNGIRPEGIIALADCLASNTNLRVVNFNDNTATVTGSRAIAAQLGKLTKLEELSLGDCLCRDVGCAAIVAALSPATHPKLKLVDLSGAELTAAAAVRISKQWKQFAGKCKLAVSSNNYGDCFHDVKETVAASGLDCGESDDDQGSLSGDEDEERMSGDDSDDDYDSDVQVVDENAAPGTAGKIAALKSRVSQLESEYWSRTQEATAGYLLQLAGMIGECGGDRQVVDMCVDAAVDVVRGVEAARRFPIPPATQLVNQLIAQCGASAGGYRPVKAESSLGAAVCAEWVECLLRGLLAKGVLEKQRETIHFFFKKA